MFDDFYMKREVTKLPRNCIVSFASLVDLILMSRLIQTYIYINTDKTYHIFYNLNFINVSKFKIYNKILNLIKKLKF